MLLAIDVGNTQLVAGVWDGASWRAVWRRGTVLSETEDELAAWLKSMFDLASLPFRVEGVVVGSVAPALNAALERMAVKWLGVAAVFLEAGPELGLSVQYDPPTAVGADRIANALAARASLSAPIVIVDFGTATTFDAISRDGSYVGGAIMPGIEIATKALVGMTAKLPQFELRVPERAIGRNTIESLQAGTMLGYAGAIDVVIAKMEQELGGNATAIATGGLGGLFIGVCQRLAQYLPNLTLDGLVIVYSALRR